MRNEADWPDRSIRPIEFVETKMLGCHGSEEAIVSTSPRVNKPRVSELTKSHIREILRAITRNNEFENILYDCP